MKITKQALKRIIKEEITSVLNEAEDYGPSELERLFSSLFKQRRTDAHPNGLDAARAAQILKTEHPDIEEGDVEDLAAHGGAAGNREQETWGYAVARELAAEQGGSIKDKLQAALDKMTKGHTLDEDGDNMDESQRAPAAFIPIQEVAAKAGIDVSELATLLASLDEDDDLSWISLRVEVPLNGPHNL
jgi:hypothetical protein